MLLARLGPTLADIDGLTMGLIAEPQAEKLYQSLDFEIVDYAKAEDGEEKIKMAVMARKSGGGAA